MKKNVKETYGGDEEVSVVSKACSKRHATALPNLNQFDAAVARQLFQTLNLIQSRQIENIEVRRTSKLTQNTLK